MIDRTLVKERLALLAGYLEELENLRNLSREEFLQSRNAAAAESFLRRSLEAIFDTGRHILSKTGGVDLAREYKSIARGLAERGIVDDGLGEKLTRMAGYRNRMVHLYHQIGNEELYDIIQNNLDDIRSFVHQVIQYLHQS